jgi:hypothetical protein
MQIFGEMVHDKEKLSSCLDSAPKISIKLAKLFINVFNKCKNAGLCYQYEGTIPVVMSIE